METPKTKEELEKQKLQNEIRLQQFEIDEEEKLNVSGKKRRDKNYYEGLKTWSQTIATLFLGVVGLIFTSSNSNQQEANRKMMSAIQLMSEREKSETDFRREMFQPMINQILSDTLRLKKRMAIFRVFQNNFHDLFNSRALYDVLDDTIRQLSDTTLKTDLLKNIKSLAHKTNEDEMLLIGGDNIIIDSFEEGATERKTFAEINTEEEHHWWHFWESDDDDKPHQFKIKLDTVNRDSDFVKIILTLYPEPNDSIILNNGEAFKVKYYDSPLTDNILLPDKHRIAVVLDKIYSVGSAENKNMAKLRIIHFPGDFITTGYRPSMTATHNMINEKPGHHHH